MNIYSIALFFHIVGALGFFVALGLEWTGLRQIRKAVSPDQVRGWMGILKSTRKVGFVSMLTAVITGIYMMVTVWGGSMVGLCVDWGACPGDRPLGCAHRSADGCHRAGAGLGKSTAVPKLPQPGGRSAPVDLPADPEWQSPWASSFSRSPSPI